MSCYMPVPSAAGARGPVVAPVPFTGKAVCVKYQFKCSEPDGQFCSNAAAEAGAFAWMYSAFEGADADCGKVKAMLASLGPAAKGAACCATPNCNAPDPSVDKATTVIKAK